MPGFLNSLAIVVILLSPPAWALAVQAAGPALPQKVDLKDGISIRLPAGWVEIPKATIDKYCGDKNQYLPALISVSYDYGFQESTDVTEVSYPCVFVQIGKSDTVSAAESQASGPIGAPGSTSALPAKLDSSAKAAAWKTHPVKTVDGDSADIVAILESGESSVFDRTHEMLWMQESLERAHVGRVKGLTGNTIGFRHNASVHCFAQEEDFHKYADTFKAVITSVSAPASEQVTYAASGLPSSGDGLVKPVAGLAVAVVLLTMVGGMVVAFIVCRKVFRAWDKRLVDQMDWHRPGTESVQSPASSNDGQPER